MHIVGRYPTYSRPFLVTHRNNDMIKGVTKRLSPQEGRAMRGMTWVRVNKVRSERMGRSGEASDNCRCETFSRNPPENRHRGLRLMNGEKHSYLNRPRTQLSPLRRGLAGLPEFGGCRRAIASAYVQPSSGNAFYHMRPAQNVDEVKDTPVTSSPQEAEFLTTTGSQYGRVHIGHEH